jgi:hypothetical protein
MTITYRSRPMTPAETAAGWGAVLEFSVPQMKPTYLADAADVATWHESPMAAMMARVMGVTFAPAHEAS